MSTRRYGDDEVHEIFTLATTGSTSDPSLPAEGGGLTLDDLQRIGQEAGIEPARVARAAALLDARGRVAPGRRSFGLPVGVARVVPLPRAPTDREWEQLIAEFRDTFGTQGRVTTSGGLRQWSVGNLHISLEPTASGEQLRLSTHKDDAVALNGLGAGLGAMAVLMSAVVDATGSPAKALAILSMFGAMSVVAFGINVVRLPRWARTRERQMEAIAEHAVRMLATPADPAPPA